MSCRLSRTTALISFLLALIAVDGLLAAAPRVLPEGKQPNDARLQPPKDLNGYFPMAVPGLLKNGRGAEQIRRQILVAEGLWPLPERTPLNAVSHGLIDKGDYTVEKVFFESVPGFFVTGNLYRPENKTGPLPGVLFAHGHWNDGRFIDIGRQAVRKEIVIGSERFESGGRSLLQALPVQVARMGCVCFHFDMIGYADSQQLSYELAHRFAKQRPEMSSPEAWGLFSPQAEANLQSIMGLQTWNAMRALDFLLSLPNIDATRIAMTGASGGGTQTMLLAGIDPRITVSFPAVMVSTAMQGGCTCENASCLRVDTGNIEFAGLFAPKPMGMTAANDWTKEMATKGYPELQALYKLLGADKNVQLFANTHFNHNYNYVSRATFYGFINKHFKLGLEEPVVEEDYERLTREEMSVWDATHPRPESGDEFERKLCRNLYDAAQKQLIALTPKDSSSLTKFREVVGGALATIVGRTLPAKSDLEMEEKNKITAEIGTLYAGLLKNKSRGEELPMVLMAPKNWNARAIICITDEGKSALFSEDGGPRPAVKRALDAGCLLVGVDLLFQGEFLPPDALAEKNRTVQNRREFAGYTYGYNRSLLAHRVGDLLNVISFVKKHDHAPKSVELVSLDNTAPIAAAALALSEGAVHRAVLDTRAFRFGKLTDYLDANFLPGGAKYGDLPGVLSLSAGTKLWLAGETQESAALVQAAYGASGTAEALTLYTGPAEDAKESALTYLLKAN